MSGNVQITNRVYWRDSMGQFAAAIGTGAARAIVEASEEGARLASEFAPKGRTLRLAGGIHPISRGAGQGGWATSDVPEALPQEKGAAPHVIGADGSFLASKEDGFFAKGPVWHPGNPAVHYMARSLAFMRGRLTSLLRRNMP